MPLKKSNDTIGSRTRDLPVCSVVRIFACNGAKYLVTLNNDHSQSVFRKFSSAAVSGYTASRVDSEFILRFESFATGPCPLTHADHISCQFEFSIIHHLHLDLIVQVFWFKV